jgi:hypothetical protein
MTLSGRTVMTWWTERSASRAANVKPADQTYRERHALREGAGRPSVRTGTEDANRREAHSIGRSPGQR